MGMYLAKQEQVLKFHTFPEREGGANCGIIMGKKIAP